MADMDARDERALAELAALLAVPGALKIITNEVRDELKDLARLHVDPSMYADLAEYEEALAGWREHYADPINRDNALFRASESLNIDYRRRVASLPALPGTDLKRPSSMVMVDAIAMEGPDDRGMVRVASDRYRGFPACVTAGRPAAVLARLLEWKFEPPPAEATAELGDAGGGG